MPEDDKTREMVYQRVEDTAKSMGYNILRKKSDRGIVADIMDRERIVGQILLAEGADPETPTIPVKLTFYEVRKPEDYALNNRLQEVFCETYIDSIIKIGDEMNKMTPDEMRGHEVQHVQ